MVVEEEGGRKGQWVLDVVVQHQQLSQVGIESGIFFRKGCFSFFFPIEIGES